MTACAREAPGVITSQSEITCGSGFGPPGSAENTKATRPIWSVGWEQGIPSEGSSWTDRTDGTQSAQIKVPVSVTPDTAGTIQILSPDSARMIVAAVDDWAQIAEIDSLLTTEAKIPECPEADTYPGLIHVTKPQCVVLEVIFSTEERYTVEIPVRYQECNT